MRIAAIDIGTNSVHMIIVRVRPDLSFEVVDREKVMVRLGAGGLDGKSLTTEAMNAALQALSKHSLVDGLKQAEELDPARLRQLARQIARTQTELVKVQAALDKQQAN